MKKRRIIPVWLKLNSGILAKHFADIKLVVILRWSIDQCVNQSKQINIKNSDNSALCSNERITVRL